MPEALARYLARSWLRAMKSRKVLAVVLVGLLLGALFFAATACGDATAEPATTALSPTATAPATPSPTPSPTATPRPTFTISGTGPEAHEIELPEGSWTVRTELLTKNSCLRDPCPIEYFEVRVDHADPDYEGRYTPIDLQIRRLSLGEGQETLHVDTRRLWVGRLGDVESGMQRVVIRAELNTEWTLTFEDHGGPSPAPPSAGAAGKSFTISGTGPARREINLAEGTWRAVVDISGNSLHCADPGDRCVPARMWIDLTSLAHDRLESLMHRVASEWTGRVPLVVTNRHSVPPGPVVVRVNVVPKAKWTLTFIANGDPIPALRSIPTPTPTLDPAPTPMTLVPPTIAEIQTKLPCLTAAEAAYAHAVLVELATGQERFAALGELVEPLKADPRAPLGTVMHDLVVAARSSMQHALAVARPSSTFGEELQEAVVAVVDTFSVLVDLLERALKWRSFNHLDNVPPNQVLYAANLEELDTRLAEACQ